MTRALRPRIEWEITSRASPVTVSDLTSEILERVQTKRGNRYFNSSNKIYAKKKKYEKSQNIRNLFSRFDKLF